MAAPAPDDSPASSLAALRVALAELHRHRLEHADTRGAIPALTVAKHQLRDWVERRLPAFDASVNEDAINRDFQDALAELHCPDGCVSSALGFVDPVRLHRQGEFLIVQTSVGIRCGYDDSAYAYQWSGKWTRIFETEQDVYTKAGYRPQTIYSLQISAPDADGSRLVLTLGSRSSCADAYQALYSRLWRIATSAGGAKPKLLLDAAEAIFAGDYPPVRGTLTSNDTRIEFTAGGTGYGSSHQAVRHYEVRGNIVKQVDPIASAPRDFVEEWLNAPWKESAARSESPALEAWHRKLHRDDGMGDFPDPPLQCSSNPELWQIGIRLHGVAAETFYLVRWRQQERFMMVDIAEHPLCEGK